MKEVLGSRPTMLRKYPLKDWTAFVAAYELDGVPCLEEMATHATRSERERGGLSLVLEAGSGSGAVAMLAAGREVFCTEDSPARVERLRRIFDDRGHHGRMHVHHAAVNALPFDDQLFDEAIWTLPILPQIRMLDGLHEIHRVLRVNGVVTVIVWAAPHSLTPTVRTSESGTHDLAETSTFVAALKGSGFASVSVEACVCTCVAPHRRAVSSAFIGSVFARQVRAWGASWPADDGPLEPTEVICRSWLIRARK